MSNRRFLGKMMRRVSIFPDRRVAENEEPPDRVPSEVVEFADPMPGIDAPGSLRLRGRGWWPADRCVPA